MNTTFSKRPYLKMVEILNETIPFIVAQKLWKGFLQQKTVLYLTIFLGLTVPITLFNYFGKKIENIDENETVEMGLGSINLGDATSIFGGYHKYVVMMLFAMFITYFMYKTLDVLSEFNGKVTLKEFFDSQIRYIVVSVRNWIAELAITIVISIVLGVFGPDWLKPLSKFLVGAYFLGYLFFDGYFHIFNMKIKESNHHIKKHITAVLVLGVVVKLLFAIPYVGAIIGSIIGAVAATWYLHTSEERQIFTETI